MSKEGCNPARIESTLDALSLLIAAIEVMRDAHPFVSRTILKQLDEARASTGWRAE